MLRYGEKSLVGIGTNSVADACGIRLLADLRQPLVPPTDRGRTYSYGTTGRPASSALPDHKLLGVYDGLLDRFMPPSLLLNEQGLLLQSFGGANRYLQVRDGRVSTDLLDLVDPELKVVLGGALPRVFRDKKPVVYKGLRVPQADGKRLLNVSVEPVTGRGSSLLHALITLEDLGEASALHPVDTEVTLSQASQDQLLALEGELRYTKENLQATIEELETSNEELQATNEELHSVKEELFTVNGEYQKKITELTELTADMDNLLQSTQVHTLFLDQKACIRKFTPQIAETFNLLPQDVGRCIDGFSHGIDLPAPLSRTPRSGLTEPTFQAGKDRSRPCPPRLNHGAQFSCTWKKPAFAGAWQHTYTSCVIAHGDLVDTCMTEACPNQPSVKRSNASNSAAL